MSDFEVLYLPSQWRRLKEPQRRAAVCVVIDVVRATTTFAAALSGGAAAVRPIATVDEARALKEKGPKMLLAGERGGVKLPGFDLGNSPREMTREKVAGREIISTTTNGTQALAACVGARETITAAFVNLEAATARLKKLGPPWLVICAGFEGHFGMDDAIVAGALAEALEQDDPFVHLYHSVRDNLADTLLGGNAGRELVKVGHGADVPICAELNRFPVVPMLGEDGALRAG